jgi:uncharacterized oxidoreductase
MSACTIAEGKIRVALNSGRSLPDGCVIDYHGQPTTDPRSFYADPPGAILPIAGHKGYGLSVIIEMLAGALTGGSCTNPEHGWRVVNGMLTIVLDPAVFSPGDGFHAEVRRFIDFVKSSRTVRPDGEILMPGQLEQRTKARRLREGIELDDVTWGQIGATARALEVEHALLAGGAADPAANREVTGGLTIPGCGSIDSPGGPSLRQPS